MVSLCKYRGDGLTNGSFADVNQDNYNRTKSKIMKLIKFKFALVTALLTSLSTTASAYDFWSNGIYYNILSYEDRTCEVTYRDFNGNYRGDLVIPATVERGGVTYTVKAIGENAFCGSSNLTSVTIPNSVDSIKNWSFNYCKNIKKIEFIGGESTLSLGYGDYSLTASGTGDPLFHSCPLETVYIGRTLSYDTSARAGYSPFYNQEKMNNVTISNKVTKIGQYLFRDCKNLTNIDFPNSITEIGIAAFSGCTALTKLVIPESVERICDQAFNGCISMSELRLKDGDTTLKLGVNEENVKHGGKGLFSDCPLEYIYLGRDLYYLYSEGAYSHGIADRYGLSPFYAIKSLKELYVGPYVKSINFCAFGGCDSLKFVNLGKSLVSIKRSAFSWCKSLTNVTIPNSVTSIDRTAFLGCTNLAKVVIGNAVTSIGFQAFAGCTRLTDVSFGNSLQTINAQAFSECSSLTNITIPSSVTAIDATAFTGTNLSNVVIEDGTKTMNIAEVFKSQPIKNLYLGRNMAYASISSAWHEYSPFYGNTNIKNITIGSKVTNVGHSVFFDCAGITSVTSLNPTPPTLYASNFTDAQYQNDTLYVPAKAIEAYKTADNWKKFQHIQVGLFEVDGICYKVASHKNLTCSVISNDDKYSGTVVIPNTVTFEDKTYAVTAIENGAFNDCTGVTKLIIEDGDSVLTCGYNFYSSSGTGKGLFYDCPIESVYMGRTISYPTESQYGDSPFYSNKNLTAITIGNKVDSIGNNAFAYCSNLAHVTMGDSVTYVGSFAFAWCASLTNIVLPNSVTSIGSFAFSQCTSLTNVILPSFITSIDTFLFSQCTSLTRITIPSIVTTIKSHAFYGCTSLTNVVLPNSIKSIENSAFRWTGLTSLSIPASVTSIDNMAFEECSLTSILVDSGNKVYDSRENCNAIIETATNTLMLGCENTIIPNSVTSIGDFAFAKCSSLTNITIPNSVVSIGKDAFNRTGLKSVIIGNSVTTIGDYAFSGCQSLTNIVISSSVTSIGSSCFYSNKNLTTVTSLNITDLN